ncbi:MAG: LicD family protein [Muribaculum sp.]|nr:LicD family protein [Muribaculum sp.]
MLSFPEEFFKGEEREGFYVEEIMKRYWACCLEIVNVIDGICRKHHLTYYADWGTLLGAVRHQGFIPWDDDIDLMMKRPDYEKLMKILPRELPKEYMMTNCFVNVDHVEFHCGVTNGREMNLSKEHLAMRYGCPFVAVIDIFPLDYLPRDPQEQEIVKGLFQIIWMAVERIKQEFPPEEIEEALRNVEEYCGVRLDRTKPLRNQLWKLATQLVMSYREDEGDYLVEWCSYAKWGYRLEKQWLAEVEYFPFETFQMPVPKEWDTILTIMYEDWRVPHRGPAGHDYPAFKAQLQSLRDRVAQLKAEE